MKAWQHDETGRTTVAPECPGPRWAEVPMPPYSDRVKCKSCENGSGPHGCTDCLNTGRDFQAFAGGIEQALNDAYAEGRKDEREHIMEDAGYLSRLRSGEKTEPSDEVLRKLGLRRVVYYVRADAP